MILNKQALLQKASKFLGQDKINLLSQAYDFANKLTDVTRNPKEVLEKAGVTRKDLETGKKLLNNPLVGFFLGKEGQENVINGLKTAESLFGNVPLQTIDSSTEQAPVDELKRLQDTLVKLK